MQANTAHNSHASAWVRVVVARSILIDGKSRRVKLLLTEKTPLMPTTPACQLFERRTQCRTIFGKGVHGAQHILAMNLSLHDACTLKFAELRSEHFLRDFRDAPLQFTVAYLAGLELPKNQRLPLSAYHVDCHRNRALCS